MSYESSWAKSLHYKTIISEGSSNAAGILPTAAVRNGEGERRCLIGRGKASEKVVKERGREGEVQEEEYDSQIKTAPFQI